MIHIKLKPHILSLLTAFVVGGVTLALQEDQAIQAKPRVDSVVRLIKLTWKANPKAAAKSLLQLTEQIQELKPEIAKAKELFGSLAAEFQLIQGDRNDPRYAAVSCLTATWNDERGLKNIEVLLLDSQQPAEVRSLAGRIALRNSPEQLAGFLKTNITAPATAPNIQTELCELALEQSSQECIDLVLATIPKLQPDIRATIVERCTQRAPSRLPLLEQVAAGKVAKDLFNTNQLQRLIDSGDPAVIAQVQKIWGSIRLGNREDRLLAIENAQKMLRTTKGNAANGWPVFERVCGQCHVLHERGYEVGPNLTSNGRSSFSQLLSNVLDPSLVIGNAYQAYTVLTADGQVITGLLVEDSEDKIVLKIQGGKIEAIAREEIEEAKVSPQSLMPEGLEAQLTKQELADLFALLTLEKSPESGTNVIIPETPQSLHTPE